MDIGEERYEFEEGKLVVYKRSESPHWQMRVYVPLTRRYVRQTLKTGDVHQAIADAKKRYMRLQVRIEDNLPVFEMRIEKACDLWLKEVEALEKQGEYSESVLRVAKGAIKRYIKPYFKTRPLSSIRDAEADLYWKWRIDNAISGKSPSKITVGAELNTINQIIQWAETHGHLKRGVVRTLKKPKALAKHKVGRRPAFTPEEIPVMFGHLKTWMDKAGTTKEKGARKVLYYAVRIMYYSGMRTNDLPEFRWRDVGKPFTRNNNTYVEFYLRGKVDPEWVVVQHRAYLYLEEWRQQAPFTGPDDLVFSYEKGVFPLLEQSFRNFLKKFAMWEDPEGEPRSLYSLRHSHATHALNSGVPIEDLARNMRTSVQMIEQHYGKVRNRDKAHVLTYREEDDYEDPVPDDLPIYEPTPGAEEPSHPNPGNVMAEVVHLSKRKADK